MMLIIIKIETISLDNENGMNDDNDKGIKRKKYIPFKEKKNY